MQVLNQGFYRNERFKAVFHVKHHIERQSAKKKLSFGCKTYFLSFSSSFQKRSIISSFCLHYKTFVQKEVLQVSNQGLYRNRHFKAALNVKHNVEGEITQKKFVLVVKQIFAVQK